MNNLRARINALNHQFNDVRAKEITALQALERAMSAGVRDQMLLESLLENFTAAHHATMDVVDEIRAGQQEFLDQQAP